MSQMKVVQIHEFGGAETLIIEEIDIPRPAAGKVLVRLSATSVNPVDFKTREGKFPPVQEDKLPFVLGRDVSGRVEAIGEGVSMTTVGEAVYGMPGLDRGTYADFIILKEPEFSPAPTRINLTDAGAIPLAALTAWQGLFEHGQLARGQQVLIHGGAGGVGHFAVQFAKAEGAIVLVTGSAGDRDFLTGLGADTFIDYKTETFEDVATNVDLVLDLIGGETQSRSWSVLREGGTIISTVQEPDKEKARSVGAVPGKRYMTHPSREDLTEIAALIDTGVVNVVISDRFDLDHVAQAQTELEKGGIRGKILVTVDESVGGD